MPEKWLPGLFKQNKKSWKGPRRSSSPPLISINQLQRSQQSSLEAPRAVKTAEQRSLHFKGLSFDGETPEEWEAFVGQLEHYCKATKGASDADKKSTLLYCCNSKTYQLAISLCAPRELKAVPYAELLELLNDHFKPRLSKFAWRYQFIGRKQQQGESGKDFIADLRRIGRRCQFEKLEDHLRDQIICGVRDARLRQNFFARREVTLNEAIEEVLAADVAEAGIEGGAKGLHKSDQAVHRVQDEDMEVDAVSSSRRGDPGSHRSRKNEARKNGSPHRSTRPSPDSYRSTRRLAEPSWSTQFDGSRGDVSRANRCASCGGNHPRVTCRFRSAKCRGCGKIGHMVAVCRSRSQPTIHGVEDGLYSDSD